MERLIILQNLWTNFKLGLNWQFNYNISCNWNVNGHQYMTHNSNYLCTNIPSKVTHPMIWNAWAFYLKWSLSIIITQTPTELKPQYIYELNTSDNLPDELIPLAVDYKVSHMYPRLLNIPVLSASYNMDYITRSTIFDILKPLDIENAEVHEISWTNLKKILKGDTVNSLQELHHGSQTNNELPTIPPQSSFSHRPDNHSKQSVLQKDAQVPQEAWVQLSTLLQVKFDTFMSSYLQV